MKAALSHRQGGIFILPIALTGSFRTLLPSFHFYFASKRKLNYYHLILQSEDYQNSSSGISLSQHNSAMQHPCHWLVAQSGAGREALDAGKLLYRHPHTANPDNGLYLHCFMAKKT
ncbi:hypothetical protein [Prevotella dentasini]|uniref:hypothetical protein n=1 Tax=Prevotella dentasini TaxID=589537 RepID=UPI0011DD0A71|nr:hypothetical protein [Prevotella dentasini]